MPRGRTTINFGAFPGSSHTTVFVPDTGIIDTSDIEAWIEPVATADHSADEHMLETLKATARDKENGVGFWIHGLNTSERFYIDPLRREVIGTRLYGEFTVGWASKHD